jgi:Cu-Zn family superoxide dismutase
MPRIIAVALAASFSLAMAAPLAAATVKAELSAAAPSGLGDPVGIVLFTDAAGGAKIKIDLFRLPPGPHGFHIHSNGSCAPGPINGDNAPAGAAGGHYDPAGTGKHMGPTGMGHLGDLPVLNIDANGSEHDVLFAPRITNVGSLRGHAVVIHAGGDNYSDVPPMGGGGARIACGVIN